MGQDGPLLKILVGHPGKMWALARSVAQKNTAISVPCVVALFAAIAVNNSFQIRVKKVLQSDEEIGRMVHSVPVVVGRAMEHFADSLLTESARVCQHSCARTLTIRHMCVRPLRILISLILPTMLLERMVL